MASLDATSLPFAAFDSTTYLLMLWSYFWLLIICDEFFSATDFNGETVSVALRLRLAALEGVPELLALRTEASVERAGEPLRFLVLGAGGWEGTSWLLL